MKKIILAGAVLGAVGLIVGCGGTGSHSTSSNGTGSVFTGGSGSITLKVNKDPLNVATTSGFFVTVVNSQGQAVPDTTVVCDTEKGVAIVEPTTGREQTDRGGKISGVIGCESPGSYEFSCRLPAAGSRNSTVTVRCSGSAPTGFTGFGGAGGGLGNGGGSGVGNGNGSFDATKIRIAAVNFTDAGKTTGTADTTQKADCDTDATTVTPEVFTDTTVTITVDNQSNQVVNFNSYTYSVPNAVGSADVTSNAIAFVGNQGVTIASKAQGDLTAFFLRAASGAKQFLDTNQTVVGELGPRNVTINLAGVTDDGEEVEVSAVAGINIQNYNNCTTGG